MGGIMSSAESDKASCYHGLSKPSTFRASDLVICRVASGMQQDNLFQGLLPHSPAYPGYRVDDDMPRGGPKSSLHQESSNGRTDLADVAQLSVICVQLLITCQSDPF